MRDVWFVMNPGQMPSISKASKKALLEFFKSHGRPWPWRQTKDPYKIWISEVMLQQTTSKAVEPKYKQFLQAFPNLEALAKASSPKVLSHWSGLGYYQRAKHLLKSAKMFHREGKIPQSYKELLNYPGFGDYTARSVSSIAFGEPVGVLDGNVIRFLTRFHGLKISWWKAQEKRFLQGLSDCWVKGVSSGEMNQALMEMGSLICTSSTPSCLICPLRATCEAKEKGLAHALPLRVSKKKSEIWLWRVNLYKERRKWAFIRNQELPFFKNQWVFPGQAKKVFKKPQTHDLTHSIMHYKIYIQILPGGKSRLKRVSKSKSPNRGISSKRREQPLSRNPLSSNFHKGTLSKKRGLSGSLRWFNEGEIQRKNPSSLIQKILEYSEEFDFASKRD